VESAVRSLRIVVVDDVRAVREMTRILLGADHSIVGEAGDGRDGVATALALSPDVVIMDWHMPQLDGVQATRRIKRQAPQVAVIAFSSADDAAVRDAFLTAGAHAYVDKGDLGALRSAVRDVAACPAAGAVAPLEVTVRAWPALARVRIAARGALSERSAGPVLEALEHAPGATRLTLDLRDITSLDTAGAEILERALHAVSARGVETTIEDPSACMRRALARQRQL
jgi:CheY-like chemotaxis protein/anti-anti-sigma regulatory factor